MGMVASTLGGDGTIVVPSRCLGSLALRKEGVEHKSQAETRAIRRGDESLVCQAFGGRV